MIKLTRLNGQTLVINAELIESVEANPDTVIRLTNDQKFVVTEDIDTVIRKTVEFKRAILAGHLLSRAE